MPISVTCKCGRRFSVPPEYAGQRARCPHCGRGVMIGPDLGVVKEVIEPSGGKKPLGAPMTSPTRPFLVEVARAFLYPLKCFGMLRFTVVFFALVIVVFIPWPWIMIAIPASLVGYICAHCLSIVQHSAGGDDEIPELPDVTQTWDEILQPMFLVWAAALTSLFPKIIYSGVLFISGAAANDTLIVVFEIWDAFYFPMAIMSVAIWRSFRGLLPQIVLPTIMKIPAQHLLMAAMVWIIWHGYRYVMWQVVLMDKTTLSGALAGIFLPSLLFLYLVWVSCRIIGITHWVYRKKIGWFKRI